MWEKVKSLALQWTPGILIGLCIGAIILFFNQRNTGTPIELQPPPGSATPAPLRVQVSGAVNAPDVYELPQRTIVQDAIEAAGGFTSEADTSRLNLAGLLSDGVQIAVPTLAPTAGPGTPQPTAEPLPTTATLININLATVEELDSLPGIGPAIAQRIVDYRNANGAFTDITQLKNVQGIGDSLFEQIKDLISVN